MVIWSGLGFIVGLIGFLSLVLTQRVSQALTADPRFYQDHRWLVLVAMSIAALLTYLFYVLLARRDNASPGTSRHSLFFVPVKWWPGIFLVIGVAMLFAGNNR
jgi:hypothetical protein